MDRNYGVKIIFLGIEIVVAKIIDHDRFAVRIHDPVLLHACILILVKFEKHILGAGRRRENFQHEIRRAFKAFRTQIIRTADYEKIRLHHGLVVAVKPDVTRGQIDFTFTFMGIHTLTKQNMKFSQNLLMYDGRCRHIIEHAVDQLDSALVRKRIIVVQGVFSVLFSA